MQYEAEVVQRFYTLYADGHSPREIAGLLNAERVPPPRGTKWNASTISGSRQRASGILGNALYRGEIVWNKVRMVKDPDTGRRVSRPNPSEQWQRRAVDALRIVSDDQWRAVDARRRAKTHADRAVPNFKPRHILSGLIKCHCCGGSLVVRDRKAGRTRVECSTHKESRACANGKTFYLDRIERAVVSSLLAKVRAQDPLPGLPSCQTTGSKLKDAWRDCLACQSTPQRVGE